MAQTSASASTEEKKNGLTLEHQARMFDGYVRQYTHFSESTQTEMTFTVFVPFAAELGPVPVLYFLSGRPVGDISDRQRERKHRKFLLY